MPVVESAIIKIFSSELTKRFAENAFYIRGKVGTLSGDTPKAPIDGPNDQLLRRSIMLAFGGGAAEIQKLSLRDGSMNTALGARQLLPEELQRA